MPQFVDVQDYDLSGNEPSYQTLHLFWLTESEWNYHNVTPPTPIVELEKFAVLGRRATNVCLYLSRSNGCSRRHTFSALCEKGNYLETRRRSSASLQHLADQLAKKNGGAGKLKCLPHPPIQLRKDVHIAIRQSQWFPDCSLLGTKR